MFTWRINFDFVQYRPTFFPYFGRRLHWQIDGLRRPTKKGNKFQEPYQLPTSLPTVITHGLELVILLFAKSGKPLWTSTHVWHLPLVFFYPHTRINIHNRGHSRNMQPMSPTHSSRGLSTREIMDFLLIMLNPTGYSLFSIYCPSQNHSVDR